MKKFAILLIGLMTLSSTTFATTTTTTENTARYNAVFDGSKYIFVENGIEFSVFPDGEFDFYIPELVQGVNVNVNAGPVGISFNTGFDYDPYVQYDDFGAVIQIENTPLFYDYYGRLSQAGDVRINYRNNRIVNVGGLNIFYNNFGVFSHYTGFINVYNRNYVFSPFHNFFYRPVFNRCLVWTTPYRRFYTPLRYNYAFHRNNYMRGYRNGYANARRDFRRPNTGRVAHNNGRRGNVDRNNASFRRVERSDRNRGTVARTSREGRRTTTATRTNTRTRNNSRAVATNTSRSNSRAIASNGARTDRKVSRNGTNTRPVSRATKPTSTDRKVRSTSNSRTNRATTSRSTPSRKATSSRQTSQRRTATKPSTSRSSRATTSRSNSSRSKVASRSNTSRSSKSTSSTRSRRTLK